MKTTAQLQGESTTIDASDVQKAEQKAKDVNALIKGLGTFDGTDDFEIFQSRFEVIGQYGGWTEQELLTRLIISLEGKALEVLRCTGEPHSYDKIVDKLRQWFVITKEPEQALQELWKLAQEPQETLEELAFRAERLAALGVLQCSSKDREMTFSLPAFLDAINDKDIGYELKKKRVSSIAEALKEARYLQTISELHRKQNTHESGWKSEASYSDSDSTEVKIRRDMEDYDESGKASRLGSTSADSSSSESCSGLGKGLLPRPSDSDSEVSDGSVRSCRGAAR